MSASNHAGEEPACSQQKRHTSRDVEFDPIVLPRGHRHTVNVPAHTQADERESKHAGEQEPGCANFEGATSRKNI